MFYVNIDGVDYPSDNLPPSSTNKATIERRERRKRSKNMTSNNWFSEGMVTCSPTTTTVCLAPLPVAVPGSVQPRQGWFRVCNKEEGKTPMRYNDNYASASANVTTVQSDAAVQRDYLLGRLSQASYPKQSELASLFNLYVDNTPQTYKELIDAIKNDKFTIDAKAAKRLEVAEDNEDSDDYFFGGPFNGIIWAGPQADHDGYKAAIKEKQKQYTKAQDTIMAGDAAAGLKALQDFEAWLPEVGSKAN